MQTGQKLHIYASGKGASHTIFDNICAVSLDFWNTIAKPNPEFSAARNELLQREVAPNLKYKEVAEIYTKFKNYLDDKQQNHRSVIENLMALFFLLDPTLPKSMATMGLACRIKHEIDALFMKHPPIIDKAVWTGLERLKEQGLIIGITSNTNFVSGETIMATVHTELGMIDWAIFSDLEHVAKPDVNTFLQAMAYTNEISPTVPLNVIHIGDNSEADGAAIMAGMKAYILNSPADLPFVLEQIAEHNPKYTY